MGRFVTDILPVHRPRSSLILAFASVMLNKAALLALVGFVACGVHALPTVKRDSGTKAVFAHHIVGYTNQYTSADWQEDITQAHAAGIDGFALNVGSDDWQPGQVATA